MLEITKEDYVNMLCGYIPALTQCQELEKVGLMEWNGNQHNVEWKWNRNKLKEKDEKYLIYLYFVLTRNLNSNALNMFKIDLNTNKESVK